MTLTFWGLIVAIIGIFGVAAVDITMDTIGLIAFVLGLGGGLWSMAREVRQ